MIPRRDTVSRATGPLRPGCARRGRYGRRVVPLPLLLLLSVVILAGAIAVSPPSMHRAERLRPSVPVGLQPLTSPQIGTGAASDGPRSAVSASGSPAAFPFAWVNLTSALVPAPAARLSGTMAYDPALNAVVLFGGQGSSGRYLSDTWMFSPSTGWRLLPTGATPPGRIGATLAYEPATGGMLLFGGKNATVQPLGDTWVFNGVTWTDLTATLTAAPPGRTYASMIYDPADNETVLYGGRTPNSILEDTWVFGPSGTWSEVTNASAPGPRFDAGFAFENSSSSGILFGGQTTVASRVTVLGDTWRFAGGLWSQLTVGTQPSPRFASAFSYDPTESADLLFGGVDSTGAQLGDSWTFNGTVWTDLTSSLTVAPPPRSFATMSTSSGATSGPGSIVVFGGQAANGSALGDTFVGGELTTQAQPLVASPSIVDVNQTVNVTMIVYGGMAPYTFDWFSVPPGCTSGNVSTIQCTEGQLGSYTVKGSVTGSAGSGTATSSGSFTVNSNPVITSFTVVPYPVVIGEGNVTIQAKASGGTGTLTYSYAGLPVGCMSTSASAVNCAPAQVGTFTIIVTATDHRGVSARATATLKVVHPPSTFTSLLDRLEQPFTIAGILVGIALIALIVVWFRRRRAPRAPLTAYAPAAAPPKGAASSAGPAQRARSGSSVGNSGGSSPAGDAGSEGTGSDPAE